MIQLSELWTSIEARVLTLIHKTEARGCRVYRSTTQTLTTGVSADLSFDTEVYDTDSCWAIGDPTKLIASRDGYYMCGGGYALDTNTATIFRLGVTIEKNDAIALASNVILTGDDTLLYITVTTGMFWLSANDYIKITAYQNSGSDKTTLAATATNQNYCNGWLMRIS